MVYVEHRNELFGSTKRGRFFDYLSVSEILKWKCAPQSYELLNSVCVFVGVWLVGWSIG